MHTSLFRNIICVSLILLLVLKISGGSLHIFHSDKNTESIGLIEDMEKGEENKSSTGIEEYCAAHSIFLSLAPVMNELSVPADPYTIALQHIYLDILTPPPDSID